MMGPDTFININNGQRTRIGTYAEWERHFNDQWTGIIGVRNDIVWMNTGDVQGYNAMMYGANAAAFNALDHARTDINFDGSAILRYTPNAMSSYELGLARKTRSPNFYERYAWSTNGMAMQMIGWFGDGNGYLGNIDLVPEKAHTVSFTASWHDAARRSGKCACRLTTAMCRTTSTWIAARLPAACRTSPAISPPPTTSSFCSFANHDAWLYGINIDGKLALWDGPVYGRASCAAI